MSGSPGISVIICTYNGAKRLPGLLENLALQQIPTGLQAEYILVDNASTDESALCARNTWDKLQSSIPLQVVAEPTPGLSYARQKGIESAQYQLLLFCDDDNWLEPNYLQLAAAHYAEHPATGILGGWGIPLLDSEKPAWFDRYENVYAVGRQSQQSGIVNERKYLYGAGMVLRKKIFDTLKEMPYALILTDRNKDKMTSGNDSEICLLALLLGYNLYYDERMQFRHVIPGGRLNWSYCVKMLTEGFAYPQFYFAMYDYCYKEMAANRQPVFENVYRWNLRKQRRILREEWKEGWKSVAAWWRVNPGNEKYIRMKTAANKIRYLKKQEQQLAVDFKKIEAVTQFCLQHQVV